MRITEITLQEKCKKITIDKLGNEIIIKFESEDFNDFECAITGRTESYPDINDMAIFWNDKKEREAMVGVVKDYDIPRGEKETFYKANDGIEYNNAIKFRDNIQFEQFLNYQCDVKEK